LKQAGGKNVKRGGFLELPLASASGTDALTVVNQLNAELVGLELDARRFSSQANATPTAGEGTDG
jgi:hypothetical protein